MRQPKYPLESLSSLREEKVDEAAGALASAVGDRVLAERRRALSETKRDAHGVAAEHVRSVQRDALERGELCADDLARAGAWELRIASEGAALASEISQAQIEEAGARAEEQRAAATLAARKADADIVAKDWEKWRDMARKRAEAKEEEESSEAWRPSKT